MYYSETDPISILKATLEGKDLIIQELNSHNATMQDLINHNCETIKKILTKKSEIENAIRKLGGVDGYDI